MTPDLIQILPSQLTFLFESKKQSSCLIQLRNKDDQYLAFKIKTTSPKKYCVRPNIGIIKPKDACDFTVTMQAQKTAPPDLNCKDKFLIQCTIVPFGTTEDDITSDMFAKDSGKYIEEKKLRVVLIAPPSSPVLFQVNEDANQDSSKEIHAQKDWVPTLRVSEEVKDFKTTPDMEEDRTDEVIVDRRVENVRGMEPSKDAVQLSLAKDFEELKSRLGIMDSKLSEAKVNIMKLTEERRTNTEEKDLLKKEMEVLKRKMNAKRVEDGFPLLFVCMVALVSMVAGYYIHP
ncbi:hypothetical protein Lal_00006424 [Lupinus albus]|uniref:Putative vesicle-associated membrane-protein-associated protein n=1 Tax=Lupinus albus TaxID=3870 RepID=A0A6A5MM23_LUPAL|nr:putative vesicle-associated membrane-protein-associated protein [Lupinus albus]KAF1875794.1 hypothetical protein Lal_00006424 [Lupinus albus]